MRLHRLELAAFGPFAGRIAVDLDELAGDGLFLLHGETGAGKTTLLDAVAYALYGRVPGARGEVRRLRSDLADPGVPTEVTLEFSVGGRRIAITRRPEYQRPKTRGSGMTTVKQSVSLRYLDGGPVEGLTRAEEVGRVVVDLLGMSAEQFFQVVLLPQGEFARFLRADTAEREALLEKLFDTGRFRTIEDFLAAARREANAAAQTARSELDRQLARLTEAAGIDASPADPSDAWLTELRQGLEVSAAAALAASLAGRAAEEDGRARLAAAEVRDAATAKLVALQAEQAALAAGAEAQDALGAAIAAAERALPVAVADRAAQAAAELEASAVERHIRARDAVPVGDRPELGVAGVHDFDIDGGLFSLTEDGGPYVPLADGPVIRSRAAAVRELAGALGALVDEAGVQDAELEALAAREGEAAALSAEMAGLDAVLAGQPAVVGAAEQAVERARAAVAALPGLEAAAAGAEAARSAAHTVVRLDRELAEADDAVRTAVGNHQRAVDERQRLVDQRFAEMAGELAAELRAGEGCPVCGSPDHPRLAVRPDRPVDAQTLLDARSVEARLADERAQRQERAAALCADRAAAVAIAGDRSVAAADQECQQAGEVLTAERAEAEALAERESALAAVLATRADLVRALGEMTGRQRGLAAAIEGLRGSTAGRTKRLAAAAAPFPTVVAHRDHLVELAGLLDGWAAAADDLDRARTARRRAEQELAKAMAEAGFDQILQARSAAALDLEAARSTARAYETRVHTVATRLADPDLSAADPDGIRVELAGLRAEVAGLAAAAEAATTASAAAAGRCRQVELAADRFRRARATAQPLLDTANRMAALADTVAGRGQNHRAMSLRSYVLAARLRQVAAVASQRLRAMSEGRYEFVHSQDRESRGRSGGLGLDILDGYTGVVRPAKTLSGGESFLASLALALGLADVVAGESGARMLDTIVIDEGFGSLDSDTLELVMATLDDLRAGGRVVGIVSHVDELRQRVPSRLRVRKGVTGSTVEIIT